MQKQYDKVEQLVSESHFSVAIFANEPETDWVLVALGAEPLDSASVADLNHRGLAFAGVSGLVDGQPRTALDRPLADATVDAMAKVFVGYFMRRFLDARPKDDSVDWLTRLYALRDPRMDA